MSETTQLDSIQKDIRDILVSQGTIQQRMQTVEASMKETRDDLKMMVNTTLASMQRDLDAVKQRPLYTPLSTQQQQDIELWYARVKTMWTAFGLAQWIVPILFMALGAALTAYAMFR